MARHDLSPLRERPWNPCYLKTIFEEIGRLMGVILVEEIRKLGSGLAARVGMIEPRPHIKKNR